MKALVLLTSCAIVVTAGMLSFSMVNKVTTAPGSRVEVFTFAEEGALTTGKIYLPDSYTTNNDLPAIYLIDFTEQHYKLATDEFDRVIDAVRQVDGLEALVVSLEDIPDIDGEPTTFEKNYNIYKALVSYVDSQYTRNINRTFIGRGSEAGLVLMALFSGSRETSVFDNYIATDPSPKYVAAITDLIEQNNIPENQSDKKLHFSFSTSNDRTGCTKLIDLIIEAEYPWLQFEYIEYTESDYENTYPTSYAAGIRYVFNHAD